MASILRLRVVLRSFSRSWKVPGVNQVLLEPKVRLGISTSKGWKSGGAKVAKAIRDDPFVKLSLSLFVIIVGGTAALEVYNKFRKRATQAVSALPPSFGHHAVKRDSLLRQIERRLQQVASANDKGLPVLFLTGPVGCGKTQILHQFSNYFIQAHQYKWFGLKRVFPVVVYLDVSSPDTLALTVAMAVKALGIKEEQLLQTNISAVTDSLMAQQVPWLLLVDGVSEKTASGISIMKQLEECSSRRGFVLVATRASIPGTETLAIPSRFSEQEASELLSSGGCLDSGESISESLKCHPLATALAASTISSFQSYFQMDRAKAEESYSKLLTEQLQEDDDPLQASLKLYLEVAVSDTRLRHTFDLLGSLDSLVPVAVSVVTEHLQSTFYAIPNELLAASQVELPAEDQMEPFYWGYVKSIKEYFFPKARELITNKEDKIGYLRVCPLLLFMKSSQTDVELIGMHPSASCYLCQVFADSTCDKLDEDHCRLKESEFQHSGWFRRYRTFNKVDCLAAYHRALPGVAAPGVITARSFANFPSCTYEVVKGTSVPEGLSYSHYVHTISHYHRVLEALTTSFYCAKGDFSASILKSMLVPHLKVLLQHPLVSHADKLQAQILTTDIEILLHSGKEQEKFLSSYEALINQQKNMLGPQSLKVAATLTNYADLLLSLERPSEAQTVLQAVLATYKKLSTRAREQACIEVGHAMSAMGRAFAQLGDNNQSKDWHEHALTTYQTIPEQGHATLRHQKLISSSLIDVAHAYLILGDLPVAKKYSELACLVLESLYPNGNSETVRILRISSVINSLMGNKEESAKFMTQASKIEAKCQL